MGEPWVLAGLEAPQPKLAEDHHAGQSLRPRKLFAISTTSKAAAGAPPPLPTTSHHPSAGTTLDRRLRIVNAPSTRPAASSGHSNTKPWPALRIKSQRRSRQPPLPARARRRRQARTFNNAGRTPRHTRPAWFGQGDRASSIAKTSCCFGSRTGAANGSGETAVHTSEPDPPAPPVTPQQPQCRPTGPSSQTSSRPSEPTPPSKKQPRPRRPHHPAPHLRLHTRTPPARHPHRSPRPPHPPPPPRGR